MTPKTGDKIDGRGEIIKIEDVGHDTSMQYTMNDGRSIMAAHWDFETCDCGQWHLHRKSYSNWEA